MKADAQIVGRKGNFDPKPSSAIGFARCGAASQSGLSGIVQQEISRLFTLTIYVQKQGGSEYKSGSQSDQKPIKGLENRY